MANVGLSTYLHAPLNEETGKYDVPAKLAGAIDFKEALDRNDAKLYADDSLQDSDSSVTGGKITLTVDDDDDVLFAPILGESVTKLQVGEKEFDKVSSKTNDVPVPQGFGFITQKNGGKYKVSFYPKVTFIRADEEAKTKEDKVEYTKPTIEGTLYPVNELYKDKVLCNTLEEAKEVLYTLFGAEYPTESSNSSEQDSTEVNTESETETE